MWILSNLSGIFSSYCENTYTSLIYYNIFHSHTKYNFRRPYNPRHIILLVHFFELHFPRMTTEVATVQLAPIESPWRKRLMLISHRTLCNIDERRHLLSRPSSSWPHPSFFQALSCATHVGGVCVHAYVRCKCVYMRVCHAYTLRKLLQTHKHTRPSLCARPFHLFRGPPSDIGSSFIPFSQELRSSGATTLPAL